jgi:hypothetical protein
MRPAFSRWWGNFFAGKLFVTVEGWGNGVVHKTFSKRPLRRRIIALVAAYAIALASLIATFGTAQSAAEAVNQPAAVLCHSNAGERPVPDGKICVDYSCCTGCLAMIAALPPPAATAAVPQALSEQLAPLAHFVLVGGTEFISHRPRGPPPTL